MYHEVLFWEVTQEVFATYSTAVVEELGHFQGAVVTSVWDSHAWLSQEYLLTTGRSLYP